jgi:hypothetical protein
MEHMWGNAMKGSTNWVHVSLAAALGCGWLAGCGGGPTSPLGGNDANADSPVAIDSGFVAVDGGEDAGAVPTESGADAPSPGLDDGGVEGGVVSATFATARISLGAGSCGGAPVSKTFDIVNAGTAPLIVSATVAGDVFDVSPASLAVAVGQTGTLTVSATVPQASTAGTPLTGALSLITNDPLHASGTIPLDVTPTGATLAWSIGSPTAANFGTQPESQPAAAIMLSLGNTGNAPATVTMAAPGGVFSLSPGTGTIAASGSQTLTAGFTPGASPLLQNATSAFTVVGAICGNGVASLSFSGQGGTSNLTGWPTGFDFGGNACGGSAAAPQTFTLSNAGTLAAHITGIATAGYAGYTTSVAVGSAIAPNGGTLVVSLSAPAIAFPSAVPGDYSGSVTFTTDVANDLPHQATLTEHAVGAVLAFDVSGTPNFGNFPTVPAGLSANQSFKITNTGNHVSSVTLATSAPFGVMSAAFNVNGGDNQDDTATFSPSAFGPFDAALVLTGTDLCQPIPTPAPDLSGTGQAGGIAFSTGSLSFSADCGSTAPPQTFTITNNGNASMTWNATLGFGLNSPYAIAPVTDTLTAGAQSIVTVTPNPIPQLPANTDPSAFADAITITTDIVNVTPPPLALGETPLGDIFVLSPTALAFGANPVSTSATPQTFTVKNAANAGSPAASVVLASTDMVHFPMSSAGFSLAAGATSTAVSVSFHAPATPGGSTSNIIATWPDGEAHCASLPTPIVASGTATEAGPVIQPPSLAFGLVNCGATASPQQITATNTGSQAYTITGLAFGLGASSYYTVAMVPASGVVDVNGQVTLTVTPKAIPPTVPSVPDSGTYSDSLTITTNANIPNPIYVIALGMGAHGVIVDNTLATTNWTFGTVNLGSTGFYNVAMHNSGNANARISLSGLNYPAIFGLQNSPTFEETVGGSAPGGFTITGTFAPPSGSGNWADTGILNVAAETGQVLCQPLPATWQTPTITFSGGATNNPIVSLSPSSVTFPAAACGGTLPSPEFVTLFNSGGVPQPYSAVLATTNTATGTFYSITSGATGSVLGGGHTQITVAPTVDLVAGDGADTGGAPYNDTLVISIAGTQYYLPTTMTVNGVVLAALNPADEQTQGFTQPVCASLATFQFDYYAVNESDQYLYGYSPEIQNTGNISGTVSATFTGWSAPYFTSTPGLARINPGAQQHFNFGVLDTACAQNWTQGFVTFSSPNMCDAPLTIPIGGIYEN